jgi:hypothetical protein
LPAGEGEYGGGEHVDSATEEIFQVLPETDRVEQGSIGTHVHETIQIAGQTGFSADLRPKTERSGAVFAGDPPKGDARCPILD